MQLLFSKLLLSLKKKLVHRSRMEKSLNFAKTFHHITKSSLSCRVYRTEDNMGKYEDRSTVPSTSGNCDNIDM